MAKNKSSKEKRRVFVNTMVIAIVIGAVFVWLELAKEFRNIDLGFLDVLEYKAIDLKFRSRGQIPTQNKVVIAAVDERSLEKYGRWPWDRKLVAKLIDKLDEKGARVIGFDIIFADVDKNSLKYKLQELRQKLFPDIPPTITPEDTEDEEDEEEDDEETESEDSTAEDKEAEEPEEDSESREDEATPEQKADQIAQQAAQAQTQDARYKLAAELDRLILENDSDRALAEAIERAEGKVVLGFFIFPRGSADLEHLDQKRLREDIELIATSKIAVFNPLTENPPPPKFISGPALRAPLPMFSECTDYFGHFTFQPDRDGTLRWATLVHAVDNPDGGEPLVYPSLSLKSAAVYLGGEDHSIIVNYYDPGVHSISIAYADPETGKEGRIDIPTDYFGRMLINYHGREKTFPHYSAVDILEDKPGIDLKDKIVLIGVTAIGVYDLRVTPFQETFPGVEVHANIIDNIIAKQFIRRPYEWAWLLELGLLVFFALMFGWAIQKLKAIESIFVVLFFLAAFALFDRYYLFERGYVVRTVLILAEGFTIMLVCYVYRYLTEERERKRIRSMFSHYLNDDIIRELEADPSKMKLGGEKKELTMLFSDIAGFTSISEKMPADELTVLLNQYLTPMTQIVFQNKGLLDKYIGDAVMAVFGTPYEEDHAYRACKTAVEMQRKIKELQPVWKEHGIENFHARIGINTGVVSVGNMGSDIRFDYTVIGDAVNLASRLEGINKQYGTLVCISENTYEKVKDRVIARELDAVRVKGKKEPTKIYELIDLGKPTPEQRAWIETFEEALEHYRRQEWDKAEELFKLVSELRGEPDPPSQVYLKRIELLRQNPPGPDWDGVWTMTTK